jgi:hypothetical protein
MFDTVNFWIDKTDVSGCKTFDTVRYPSEITERQNEHGYSCTGKVSDYAASVFENGMSMKGSLSKGYFGDNPHALTRRETERAVEEPGDRLRLDVRTAKVTRLDVSTVIPVKRPPAGYYGYWGNRPYFERLQSTPDTLYYNSRQRQIVFYDKTEEAAAGDVRIPDILRDSNLFSYELRYTKRLAGQLNGLVRAAKPYDAFLPLCYSKTVQ